MNFGDDRVPCSLLSFSISLGFFLARSRSLPILNSRLTFAHNAGPESCGQYGGYQLVT